MRKIWLSLLLCGIGFAGWADPMSRGIDPVPAVIALTTPVARPTSAAPPPALPASVDLSPGLPPVASQGPIGSCAAWSTVYYGATLLEEQANKGGADQTEHQLSPLFTYWQITEGKNEGTAITDHMQILQTTGGVSLADFPVTDRLDAAPDPALKNRGTNFRIASFAAVPRRDGAVDLDAVRTVLSQGHPVIGGFNLFQDFQSYSGGVYSTTEGPRLGGHAMAVVGYDDDKQALRIVNSWGQSWGEAGFAWISYDSVRAMTHDDFGFAVMYGVPDASGQLSPPEDLTASQGEAADHVSLSWTPVPNTTSVVLRADNASREWKELGATADPVWVDTPLPPGVTYVYSVRARRTVDGNVAESDPCPMATGSTQAAGSVPGTVEGLQGLLQDNSVILFWRPLTDVQDYEVYRYLPQTSEFAKIGTSTQAVYRDLEAFSDGEAPTYMVLAANAQGQGPTGSSVTVRRTITPAVTPAQASLAEKQTQGERTDPRKQPYGGKYHSEDWFDPQFSAKAFADFAAKEKAAFDAWKNADQDAFRQFLETQGGP